MLHPLIRILLFGFPFDEQELYLSWRDDSYSLYVLYGD